MAGVATEKPGTHPYTKGACSLPQSYWLDITLLDIIYLFSETQRGYREAGGSEGSFKHTWLFNLDFFGLGHYFFQCLA